MSLSLNKNDWFVDPNEATDENLVTPLIDGMQLFSEINNHLVPLGTDDFCFFAAWEITPDFRLTTSAGTTLAEQFKAASTAGADVRVLLFGNWKAEWDKHMILKRDLEGATNPSQVLIDTKYHVAGSHHQKFCIFGKHDPTTGKYTLTAFCGGIDPGTARFDDNQHRPTESMDFHLGWHDGHAKVEGPAAEQLLETFVNRWNDHNHPLISSKYNTATTSIGQLNLQLPTLQNNTHQVEVLHTYACIPTKMVDGKSEMQKKWGYTFAGNGIQTIKQAYLKSISQAQHYIYIENQYFTDNDIIEALIDKLNTGVSIIAVTPYYMGSGYDNLRLDAWKLFKQSPKFNSFYLCDLRHPGAGYSSVDHIYPDSNYREPIYVHVKLMIVDDVYALIGSANMNVRSMESDSELAIAVLDTLTEVDHHLQIPVCKFARDLRISLFGEHWLMNWGTNPIERSIQNGISTFASKINDPVAGIETIPPTRLFRHNPEKIWYSGANRLMILPAEKRPKCQF